MGMTRVAVTLLLASPAHFIEVEQGQQVTLELKSLEGLHSLAIPEYGVQSPEVRTGETATVTFQALRAGEFGIECRSACGGLQVPAILVLHAATPDPDSARAHPPPPFPPVAWWTPSSQSCCPNSWDFLPLSPSF